VSYFTIVPEDAIEAGNRQTAASRNLAPKKFIRPFIERLLFHQAQNCYQSHSPYRSAVRDGHMLMGHKKSQKSRK
jgi:hypothetical protein